MFSWHRLHSGVKAIFFVQIVNRMGDFVVPFLTLILTQVQGFSPALAGVVVTMATGLGSLGGLVSGKLADQHSRRDVLVLFLGISGILLAGAGFAPQHFASAAAMVASGFFLGAMRPILGALIADLADPETRRAAFSLSYLGINIGVAIGPLLAGWLFEHALNWLFWLDALSTAAALTILIRFVPRKTAHGEHLEATSTDPPGSSIRAFVHHPILFPFSLLTLVYNFVYSQMIFTQSLQLVDLFGDQGAPIYGLVWAINAMTVVALTPLALKATKAWSNLGSMAVGMVFYVLGLAVFLFRPDLTWVVIATLWWTTGEVLFSVHHGDLISSHSLPHLRARFQSYVGFLGSLGFVVSPVISGFVAQILGLTGVWWLALGAIALVGLGYAVLNRRAHS